MHFQYEACHLDAFCLLMQRHTDIEFFLKTWQNYCYLFDIPGKKIPFMILVGIKSNKPFHSLTMND